MVHFIEGEGLAKGSVLAFVSESGRGVGYDLVFIVVEMDVSRAQDFCD